jgi:beta-glucanase (GH16 family)
MRYIFLSVISLFLFSSYSEAQTQTVMDDFEGNGTITTWFGDACNINTTYINPYQQGINNSATVMQYKDVGGQYANVRFDINETYDLISKPTFSLKIYVPSSGLSGTQPNQVSFKLQDGTLAEPWLTQCDIIKPIVLDQWQIVNFDFLNDDYINFDPNSPPPTQRTDFNRVLIQVNGENNYDYVVAYIDDVNYNGTIPSDPEYDVLVWSDEFDVVGAVDNTKWHHETQPPNAWGWHGGEVQHYTDRIDNSYVSNGILHIVGKKETYTDQGLTKEYTSARLNSKFAFQYGKVEVRAKLPAGAGTFPAIWTLGKNINVDGIYWDTQGYGTTNWPYCGEIDIIEHWGTNQNFVSSATHTPSSYGATVNHGGQTISNASTEFHTYTLKWYPEKLVFSVDGVTHYTYRPSELNGDTWPYIAEQFLLLNFAILPEIDAGFVEDAMEIDYVRVYQSQASLPTDISIDNNTVDENCSLNTVVGKFSTTNLDEFKTYNYSYSLVNGNGINDVDNTKFVILGNDLKTNAEIDYETQNTFHINIQTDNGNGGTYTKAFILAVNNLNDNSPELENASFSIDENSPNETVVGTVTATDADDDLNPIAYSITSGNTNDAFVIDNATGKISVNQTAELDFETTPEFTLAVKVSDGTNTENATVNIRLNNLNDNLPVLEDANFTIDENSAAQTVVGTVTATEADGDLNSLTYSITAGNTNDVFAIDNTTGEITVKKSTEMDYETTPEFTLTVEVSDGTNIDTAIVTIALNNLIETSIDDLQLNKLDIYPNPSNGIVTIDFSNSANKMINIELININGQILYSENFEITNSTKTIDLSSYSNGIYFMLLKSNDSFIKRKIVLE